MSVWPGLGIAAVIVAPGMFAAYAWIAAHYERDEDLEPFRRSDPDKDTEPWPAPR